MSRKDYTLLAAAIAEMPSCVRPPVADHIGSVLAEDNPRFNWDKWSAACGVADNERGMPFPQDLGYVVKD